MSYNICVQMRIGAAYKLASIGDEALALTILEKALYEDRESVRRAATYGLVAVGPAATDVFLRAVQSDVKWVRKAGVYGLGDCAHLSVETLQALTGRLTSDASVYVRSVAAGSLGCLGRRAAGTGVGVEHLPEVLTALMGCLDVEVNRLAADRAQGRSIKFVRPTDDSDVCEVRLLPHPLTSDLWCTAGSQPQQSHHHRRHRPNPAATTPVCSYL